MSLYCTNRKSFVRMTSISTTAATGNRYSNHSFDPGPLSKSQRGRLKVIFVAAVICFIGIAVRLLYLHAVSRGFLLSQAEKQRWLTVAIPSRRGDILDRNHRKLATTIDAVAVHAFPGRVAGPARTAQELAPILGRSKLELLRVLSASSPFVWVQRKVEPDVAERIERLSLEGIGFTQETKRSYPKGTLASHVIGFVGVDGQGLEGLELQFDDTLRGVDGWRLVERDARQRPLLPLTKSLQEPSGGNTVVLTIDEVIQHIVEEALDTVYTETNAAGAVAVVQDPATGEILAMASRPSFDPNDYRAYPVEHRRSRVVTDAFEPGSCMKVIPTAALIQEKLVDPTEVFYCENGAMWYCGRIMHDYEPHGNLTFAEVISKSSNIGMIKAASRLRKEQLYEYYKLFGFGQKTGLSFPGEIEGTLRPPSMWSLLSMASLPIGQEISVTPLQLVRAFSAIANDGIMMKPVLVREIRSPDGDIVERFGSQQQRRVISRSAADLLEELMAKVVEDGSGREAAVSGYRAAGKTGTAQKVDPVTGNYCSDKHVAVFCGFVPAHAPALTILVLVDYPRVPIDTGGKVAAPVFREIAQASLSYLRVPPDAPQVVVAQESDDKKQDGTPQKETVVVAQPPASPAMPDLTGMSKREVVQALSSLSVRFSFEGSGHVVGQSIAAGQMIAPGDVCKIIFAKDGKPDEAYRVARASGNEPR